MQRENHILLTAVLITAAALLTATHAAAAEKVLHNFGTNALGGEYPNASLIFDAAGNLYGTAQLGGANSCGVAFELLPRTGGGWTEKVLHNFGASRHDGCAPLASLIFDAAGNLYGTTSSGGYGGGTVFKLSPAAGGGFREQILHYFDASFGNGGYETEGNLIFDASGNLYGTASKGGALGYGLVFELVASSGGEWPEKILHAFNGGTQGSLPLGGLIFDAAGNLYGTTAFGGSDFGGTGFEMQLTEGGSWGEIVLHDFSSLSTDGELPTGNLIFDSAGNLYGTTSEGGTSHQGTVFQLSPNTSGNWSETVLHSFNCQSDGCYPFAALVMDAAGNLYGTTSQGGTGVCENPGNGCGIVFKLTQTDGTWSETVLQNFGNGAYGANPSASLMLDGAGNLYGTTELGGVNNVGTVFEITQ